MAIFKCKMCGGDLNVTENQKIVECEYCGIQQTVPAADNEKKVNLFNRANRLRINSEFDKAAGIYENIIAEFPEEAEAYWGLILSNYGIEYVDDPLTAKKIPTCHRASFEKIQNDENYLLALEYSDVVSQKLYRDEAREIDRIMEDILSVSKNESPYDVFICYKETDDKGDRTVDSVLAQDIYDALTAKGMKVFFSRITLEDKLGQQYEPYIFAALNSAKVMLAIGTKYEYFHAVWVKNEWSRFMKLMAADKSKVLIPCFKDIDAYDMPEEFKALQAQDMGKIGFIQDLVRGVEKIVNVSQGTSYAQPKADIPNIDILIKRGNMAIEDDNWSEAKSFFSQVLNYDIENAEAYLGLAMIELRCKNIKELTYKEENLNNNNYKRAKQYAKQPLLDELNKYEKEREEERRVVREALARTKERHDKARPERIKKHSFMQGLIAAGACHSAAVANTGKAVATFYNTDNYEKHYKGWADVSDWTDIVAIDVGDRHTIGLKVDGTVIAVGLNDNGQCNVSNWKDIIDIAAGGDFNVGLKSDGTVTGLIPNWKTRGFSFTNWTDIVAISAGLNHVVALRADGTVLATGCNRDGQCNVSEWNDIVAVAAGSSHTVGLKSDGTAVSTKYAGAKDMEKYSVYGQRKVYAWDHLIAIAAGNNHTVGLKRNGTVVAVGSNREGQCNVSSWTDIVAVAAGSAHTVGLKSDGTVVATKFTLSYDNGRCDVQGWRLFDESSNLDEWQNTVRRWRSNSESSFDENAAREYLKSNGVLSERRELLQAKEYWENELAKVSGLFAGAKRKNIEREIARLDKLLN